MRQHEVVNASLQAIEDKRPGSPRANAAAIPRPPALLPFLHGTVVLDVEQGGIVGAVVPWKERADGDRNEPKKTGWIWTRSAAGWHGNNRPAPGTHVAVGVEGDGEVRTMSHAPMSSTKDNRSLRLRQEFPGDSFQ